MDDLQSLVWRRLRHLLTVHGITARAAVERARDAGFRLTEERVSQLKAMPAGARMGRVAERETVLGLAVALDVPDEVVIDAALRSTGYMVPVRMYLHDTQATQGAICVDCATPLSNVDELIVVLPEPDLTPDEIKLFIQAFDDVAVRVLERRSHSG